MFKAIKWIVVSLVLLFSVDAIAQRPALQKMSAMVREACLSVPQTPRFSRVRAANPQRPSVTAFVKGTANMHEALRSCGAKVLYHNGNLSIASIPLDQISTLSLSPSILRIEAGRRSHVLMDTTGIIVSATKVNVGEHLPQGYTGQGVVVGVQDIGFDLTHPNFFSADMSRYRIGAMWDQLSVDTLNSTLPVGRDYVGRETLLALGHPRDGLIQTHGTHTAGIAAGSGAEGGGIVSPYRGIAYDSELCFVCNATTEDASLIAPSDYYKYTYAMDALGFKYIFDYAASQNKPCVINFSEGSKQDFHGDDILYYEMLESLSGPGRIIVSSAGNEGKNINYAHKPAGTASAGLFVSSSRKAMSMITRASANFTFRLKFYPTGQAPVVRNYTLATLLASADSTLKDSLRIDTIDYELTAVAYADSYGTGLTACDWVIKSSTQLSKLPISVELVGPSADVELYRVSGEFRHNSLDPTLIAGDNSHSIYSPSSAPSVICVGATGYRTWFVNYLGETKVYNNGTGGVRTPFSAVGPTWDGRIKPDVMAPGQNIISSYSTFFINNPANAGFPLSSDVRHFNYNGRTYAWMSNGGTSMAAPVVAGVIALWLQACPTLTPRDCIDIFSTTCRRYDPTLTYPNNLYGYGEIDAYAGLQEVLRRIATGVENINASYMAKRRMADDARIYTLDGRFVGTDISKLSRGIYLQGGKKIVK